MALNLVRGGSYWGSVGKPGGEVGLDGGGDLLDARLGVAALEGVV